MVAHKNVDQSVVKRGWGQGLSDNYPIVFCGATRRSLIHDLFLHNLVSGSEKNSARITLGSTLQIEASTENDCEVTVTLHGTKSDADIL